MTLSPRTRCLTILAILIGLLSATTAHAREMLWFGPVGKLPPRITGGLVLNPRESVENQPAQLSYITGNLDYEMPLWLGKNDDLSFLGGLQLSSLDTTAILPTSNVPLPHRFWDIRFGPAYRHKFSNGWVGGIMGEVGSASDEPFSSYDVLTLMTNAFLRIPAKGRDAWLILVNYMNNREYLPHIPLPFGGYFMDRKYVRGFIGMPFYMRLFPRSRVSFDLFYAPIAVVKANLKARISKSVALLTGFNWNNYRYFRANRPNTDDRLFYYEQRVYGGVEISPDMRAKLSFKAGYAFNRMMFESDSFLDRNTNRINVDAGPYARVELKLMLVSKAALERELKAYKQSAGRQNTTPPE